MISSVTTCAKYGEDAILTHQKQKKLSIWTAAYCGHLATTFPINQRQSRPLNYKIAGKLLQSTSSNSFLSFSSLSVVSGPLLLTA